jgi:hypothetical protein
VLFSWWSSQEILKGAYGFEEAYNKPHALPFKPRCLDGMELIWGFIGWALL